MVIDFGDEPMEISVTELNYFTPLFMGFHNKHLQYNCQINSFEEKLGYHYKINKTANGKLDSKDQFRPYLLALFVLLHSCLRDSSTARSTQTQPALVLGLHNI